MHDEHINENEEKEILSLSTNGIKWLFVGMGAFIVLLIAFAIALVQKGGHKAFKQKLFYSEIMNEDVLLDKWALKYNFFSKNTLDNLMTSIRQTDFITKMSKPSSSLSAGEQVPIGHLDCNHPFMVQNTHLNICHFSNRIDVGRHFLNTGGFKNDMENSEKMLSRILLFYQRQTHFTDRSEFKQDENFLAYAKQLCAFTSSDSIVDTFQFNAFLLLAGQEVPLHVDTPYFYGADRSRFPEWLLVVMKQSKLFKEIEIRDIKGIVWLTENKNEEAGGNFYLYPHEHSNNYTIFKTVHNRGIIFDGTKLANGVTRFLPDEFFAFENRSQKYSIKFNKLNDNWSLLNANNELVREYSHDEVKISVIWRAHCFENQQQMNKFNAQRDEDYLSIDEIAHRFKQDLRKLNKLPTDDIKLIDLWAIVLKEYLDYPKNVNANISFFIFNYCLLPNVMPQWINEYLLDPLLKDIC